MKNIAIIGAGWYGCHLATSLIESGYNVEVFEKNSEIFQESSGKNQFRLHCGLHYPRSYKTRKQISSTYNRFKNKYFTENVKQNIYAIAKDDSLLDYGTFITILKGENINFNPYAGSEIGLENIEGALICDERAINTAKCKKNFEKKLNKVLRLNTPIEKIQNTATGVIINGKLYDNCLNCTYNHFSKIKNLDVEYEVCVMLQYKKEHTLSNFAITIMDGKFVSLYPKCDQENIYTLSSVEHTPTRKFSTAKEATDFMKTINKKYIQSQIPKFEEGIKTYFPAFDDMFTYDSYFTSIKTKLLSGSDNRECIVKKEGNIIHIFSGKINNIFIAEDRVHALLKAEEPIMINEFAYN